MLKGKEIVNELLKREKNVIDILKEMRPLATVSLETAFAALMANDKELAKEAIKLSDELDVLQYQLEIETSLSSSNPQEAISLAAINRVGSAMEDVANSVREIVDPVLREIPIEDTIIQAFEEVGTIKIIKVKKKHKLVGKRVKEIEQLGVRVIGLKQGKIWRHFPLSNVKIDIGDVLIVGGTKEMLKKF